MNASVAALPISRPNPVLGLLWGGLLSGICDITAAFIVYGFLGAKPLAILRGIATGVLGPSARQGGLGIACLGLFLHFVIAFGAATVFFIASRFISFLTERAVIAGFLYGIAVYFFMQYVVIPLSAARRSPFSLKMTIIGIVIHMFCVGTPIALSVRKYAAR